MIQFLLLTTVKLVVSVKLFDESVDELHANFAVEDDSIRNVGTILESMKRLAYRQHFGGRRGSHDFDVAKMLDLSSKRQKSNPVSPYLFEGNLRDIFLSERQAMNILDHLENSRSTRSLSSEPDALWSDSNLPIRYRFHDSLDAFTIRLIVEAIEFWQTNTCIDFVLDDKAKGDYVQFFKGTGCYSMIGHLGGRQAVSIGNGCERHEQSRPDALKYIEIERDYVIPTYISDFELRGTDEITTLNIPYDFGSVMHYGPTAFSIDGNSLTILTKDERCKCPKSIINQQLDNANDRLFMFPVKSELLFYDVAIINKAYCINACADNENAVLCYNGGYLHPRDCSTCICPNGLGGNQCKQNEEPKNADCGGVLKATDKWQTIESPQYEDSSDGQKCSWLIKAPRSKRVKIEFVELNFLCSTTCVEFVELKIGQDQRKTGPRYCCNKVPSTVFISESRTVTIIYRTLYSEDSAFKLKFRVTKEQPKKHDSEPTTTSSLNQWSEWSSYTPCTKSCGGCGIKTKSRECLSTSCVGRTQEFASCNFKPCPINPICNRLLKELGNANCDPKA
ncbi:Zinc metalloproteinase [Aphelenchoides besseyi]|nr:Zinc metalloproteinase [Aphelenchoides besseyi]